MSSKEKELEKEAKEFYDKFSKLSLNYTNLLNLPGVIGHVDPKLSKMQNIDMEG